MCSSLVPAPLIEVAFMSASHELGGLGVRGSVALHLVPNIPEREILDATVVQILIIS